VKNKIINGIPLSQEKQSDNVSPDTLTQPITGIAGQFI
jgi:hypothetical protein